MRPAAGNGSKADLTAVRIVGNACLPRHPRGRLRRPGRRLAPAEPIQYRR